MLPCRCKKSCRGIAENLKKRYCFNKISYLDTKSVVFSKYSKIFPHPKNSDHFILFSTKRASSVIVSKSVVDDIEKDDLSAEEKETLIKLGFLIQDENTERQE